MNRSKPRAKEIAQTTQYLSFFLAEEEYAVGILRVREIIELGALTRIPSMPDWIRGVINLRGTVVPVIDLALKLGLRPTPVTKLTCVVIVEASLDGISRTMGVLVDSVSQVIDLSTQDIESPPTFGTKIRADFLLGVGKIDGKLALLLDIDQVLSQTELLAATSLAGGVPPHASVAGSGSSHSEPALSKR
jgi:purine-binding chemotaxis protein CheW